MRWHQLIALAVVIILLQITLCLGVGWHRWSVKSLLRKSTISDPQELPSTALSLSNPAQPQTDQSLDQFIGPIRVRQHVVDQLLLEVGRGAIYLALGYAASKLLFGHLALLAGKYLQHEDKTVHAHDILPFLRPNVSALTANEEQLLSAVVLPSENCDDWARLGGLEDCKRDLLHIATDLQEAKNSSIDENTSTHSALTLPVQSVLLFGPPGCGKTALIRGLAKQLDWPLIVVSPSAVLQPFVGQSSQLMRSVFSLASKMRHSVILIDEMDSLFSSRSSNGLSSQERFDRQLMTEFMQHWDRLRQQHSRGAGEGQTTLIVGLTNRPQDLDAAIQRRFERSIRLDLPDSAERIRVLQRILRVTPSDCATAPTTSAEQDFDWQQCAHMTEGFSSCDILDLCKLAVSRAKRKLKQSGADGSRPLTMQDLQIARQNFVPVSWKAKTFARQRALPISTKSSTDASTTVTDPPPPPGFWHMDRAVDSQFAQDRSSDTHSTIDDVYDDDEDEDEY